MAHLPPPEFLSEIIEKEVAERTATLCTRAELAEKLLKVKTIEVDNFRITCVYFNISHSYASETERLRS